MRASAMSVTSLARTAASRAGGQVRAYAVSASNLARTVSSRAEALARPRAARAVGLIRGSLRRARGPAATCAAVIVTAVRAMAARTEGVRTQAAVAFTLSFALAMIAGSIVLPQGPRARRAAPAAAPLPSAGPPAPAPRDDSLAVFPPVALPHFADPSKRAGDAVPLANGVPADRPQAAPAAVRSSAVRSGMARVTDIALWGSPNKPWVSITASAPVRYQLRNVEPDWVVIDVARAELALAPGKLPAGRGLVRLIRVGQFTPDVVRVVLELTQAVPIHIATSPGRTAIVVSLAADAKGNSHTEPAPTRRPGAVEPPFMARAQSRTPGT